MTDRSEWPQWLRDADTVDAIVEIFDGAVVWHDGVWRDGVWHDGVWHDGVWLDGVWHDGVWLDGVWHGGVWHGGVWREGYTSATRSMYPLTTDGYRVRIGCKEHTWREWDALIADDGAKIDGAPPRDSETWTLLLASYRALRAYHETIQEATR